MSTVLDILSAPWAITPQMLEEIHDIYAARRAGVTTDWLEARATDVDSARPPRAFEVVDGVAVIPVTGVIAQRMNLFMAFSGGTSTQLLDRDIQQALNDPAVIGIVLAIDSPGGAVSGTPDVATRIFAGRAEKPIAAWSDGTMASAAYWIGSAADRVFASSEVAQVGSIGVVAMHRDVSRAEEQAGTKTTEIYAGKFKRIASSYAPLTAEGRESIQGHVDYLYSVFVNAVASHRGVSPEAVLEKMADGRIFVGRQALDSGLIDAMGTLDDAMSWVRTESAARSANQHKEYLMELTTAQVKSAHPAIATELQAEGAVAERARIKAIRDNALPGHDALVESLIEQGASSDAAAGQILAAERKRLSDTAASREKDTLPGVQHDDAAAAAGKPTKVDPSLPIEERAKAEYAASTDLRTEFATEAAYVAFRRAEEGGRARIQSKK